MKFSHKSNKKNKIEKKIPNKKQSEMENEDLCVSHINASSNFLKRPR